MLFRSGWHHGDGASIEVWRKTRVLAFVGDWVDYLKSLPEHDDEWTLKSLEEDAMAIFLGLLTYPRVLTHLHEPYRLMLKWGTNTCRHLETILHNPAGAVPNFTPRLAQSIRHACASCRR
jgi:hypothetical protein